MTKHVAASVFACVVLLLLQYGLLDTLAAMQLQSLPSAKVYQPPTRDTLRVVLLGSASGPPVGLNQFGISTMVEANGTRFLFDCGRGATIRLTQLGVSLASVSRLFVTHLHSDHIIQIPDLLLVGWSSAGRTEPLQVWGPDGTSDMMEALQRAYA